MPEPRRQNGFGIPISYSRTPGLEDIGLGPTGCGEIDHPKSGSHCRRKWARTSPLKQQGPCHCEDHRPQSGSGENRRRTLGAPPGSGCQRPRARLNSPHASKACTILLFLDGPLTSRSRASHDVVGHSCRDWSHRLWALG